MNAWLEILIFAGAAVFILSRLYQVLGQRTGNEPTPGPQPTSERLQQDNEPDTQRPTADDGPISIGFEPKGVAELRAADPSFDPQGFMDGAKAAYKMIVDAYAEADLETLRNFTDDDVYDAYASSIDSRKEDGREPTRLLRVKSAEMLEAGVEDGVSSVLVAFVSELAQGDYVRTAKEIWTFDRLIDSRDPNWRLSDVEVAS